jgi:hypothetical protein
MKESDVDYLFRLAKELSYPEKFAVPITERLERMAFFPGGKGTIDKSDSISGKPFMFVGQDFDCDQGFADTKNIKEVDIDKIPTWRNLKDVLKDANIKPQDCFFTNAIMGLRVSHTASGKSPTFKAPTFIKENQDFFLKQIQVQKPKVVFALGIQVVKFLSGTSKSLEGLSTIKSFPDLDQKEMAVVSDVDFDGHICVLAILLHPSFRGPNLRHRSYKGLQGDQAEKQIIKDTLTASGIS